MNETTKIPLSLYYSLIILQFALPLIGAGIDMFNNTPELSALDEILYIEPQNWELAIIGIAGLIFFIILIGLFMRKEWARRAYIYTFILSLLIYFMPFMHWFYMSSLAALCNDLAFICSGMLLMILVFPQLHQSIFSSKK